MTLAVRLEARGYPAALEMTPGQLLFRARVLGEVDRKDFVDAAQASLLGSRGSEKDWKDLQKETP